MHLKALSGGRLLFAAAIGLATLAVAVPGASASTNQWKLGSYTANGGFAFKSAPLGTFAFPTVPAQCSPAPDLRQLRCVSC